VKNGESRSLAATDSRRYGNGGKPFQLPRYRNRPKTQRVDFLQRVHAAQAHYFLGIALSLPPDNPRRKPTLPRLRFLDNEEAS
jgi:hypothetical protein